MQARYELDRHPGPDGAADSARGKPRPSGDWDLCVYPDGHDQYEHGGSFDSIHHGRERPQFDCGVGLRRIDYGECEHYP